MMSEPEHMSNPNPMALLGLYECLTEPERTPVALDALADWVMEEATDTEVFLFENIAHSVWDALSRCIRDSERDALEAAAGTVKKVVYLDRKFVPLLGGDKSVLNQELLPADDWSRLKSWTNEVDHESCIVIRQIARDAPTENNRQDFIALQKLDEDAEKPEGAFCSIIQNSNVDAWVFRLFETSFALSPSEVRVLGSLLAGKKANEIAEAASRSLNTIRTQIRMLCTKLGVNTQADVILAARSVERQLGSNPSVLVTSKKGAESLKYGGEQSLSYRTYGPKNGRPVLFLHAFTMGQHLSPKIEPILRKRNVRIISISRPGYGYSTLQKKDPKSLLSQTTQALRSLLVSLKIPAIDIITDGVGLAFALELSRTHPENVRKVCALDPAVPVLSAKDLDPYVPRARRMLSLAFRSKSILRGLMRFAYYDFSRVKSYEDFVKKQSQYRGIPAPATPDDHDDAAMRWANFQDSLVAKMASYALDLEICATDFLSFPEGSNRCPEIKIFVVDHSVHSVVTREAQHSVAEALGAELILSGEPSPHFVEPLPLILDHLLG